MMVSTPKDIKLLHTKTRKPLRNKVYNDHKRQLTCFYTTIISAQATLTNWRFLPVPLDACCSSQVSSST